MKKMKPYDKKITIKIVQSGEVLEILEHEIIHHYMNDIILFMYNDNTVLRAKIIKE